MEKESREIVFENVWYASQNYAEGHLKFIAYEKIGELIISHFSDKYLIRFSSDDKLIFETDKLHQVSRKRQGFPFFLYASICAIYLIAGSLSGIRGLLYVSFMLVLSLPLALFVYFSQKWIVLEYREMGKIKRHYLYDGNYRGWAGRFGGNKKIYEAIVSAIQ